MEKTGVTCFDSRKTNEQLPWEQCTGDPDPVSDLGPRKTSAVWVAIKHVKTKLSLTNPDATPVNWKVVWLVFISLVLGSFNLTFLFPFLPEMILSFGYTEEDKGFYAGIVASAMFAGRACGSYFWGWLSDKKGRKPVILITIFLNGVFSLVFGFTTNIWMATIMRFLTGLFGGTVCTCKTILYEISDDTNQAVGMSIISLAWGGGIVLGPTVGGYLASPTKRYPDTFPPEGFFHQFPYILPGLICFFICIVAVITDFIWLPETLVKQKKHLTEQDEETEELESLKEGWENDVKLPLRGFRDLQFETGPRSAMSVEDLHLEAEGATYLAKTEKGIHLTSHGFTITDESGPYNPALSRSVPSDLGSIQNKAGVCLGGSTYNDGCHGNKSRNRRGPLQMSGDLQETPEGITSKQDGSPTLFRQSPDSRNGCCEMSMVPDGESCLNDLDTERSGKVKKTSGGRFCTWLRNWRPVELLCQFDVFLACTLYAVFSFTVIGYEELFTVWASTERRLDGLGFEPSEIGAALGASSIPLLCFQLFMFPNLARRFHLRTLFICFAVLMMILTTAIPVIHLLVDRPVTLWILLLFVSIPMKLFTSCLFSCCGLFINNSTIPTRTGSVNGLSMTINSLTRALAPLFGGSVYAWTVGYAADNIGPPFDVSFTFFLFGLIYWSVTLLGVIIPERLNRQKK